MRLHREINIKCQFLLFNDAAVVRQQLHQLDQFFDRVYCLAA